MLQLQPPSIHIDQHRIWKSEASPSIRHRLKKKSASSRSAFIESSRIDSMNENSVLSSRPSSSLSRSTLSSSSTNIVSNSLQASSSHSKYLRSKRGVLSSLRFPFSFAQSSFLLLLFFLSSSFPQLVTSQKSIIFTNIFTNYDDQSRPFFNTTLPVQVDVSFRINLLFTVTSKDETYQIDLFVKESWVDPRLQFDTTLWVTRETQHDLN